MKFIKTELPEVIICEPKVFGDHRGYFMESFKKEPFEKFIGYSVDFIQDNESKSSKGVLRGLHFQKGEFAQSKLVRVIEGEVIDVAVDLRKGSPNFGKSVAVKLSAENKKQLFVPKGFAHGFVVLSQSAIFSYKVDAAYNFDSEGGLAYNDPSLGIDWGIKESELVLSEKDTQNPYLSESYLFDYNTNYYE